MFVRAFAIWLSAVIATSLLLQLFGITPWYSPNRDNLVFDLTVAIVSILAVILAWPIIKKGEE